VAVTSDAQESRPEVAGVPASFTAFAVNGEEQSSRQQREVTADRSHKRNETGGEKEISEARPQSFLLQAFAAVLVELLLPRRPPVGVACEPYTRAPPCLRCPRV